MATSTTNLSSSRELLPIAVRPMARGAGPHAPYLVATAAIHARDQLQRQYYYRQWQDHCGPPPLVQLRDNDQTQSGGRRGSRDEKIAWLRSVQAEYAAARGHWSVPRPADFCALALYGASPPFIDLELYCHTAQLRVVLADYDDDNNVIVDHGRFAANIVKLGRRDYEGRPLWSDYATWLTKTQQKTVHRKEEEQQEEEEVEQEIVLLATMTCKRSDHLHDKIADLVERLGLDAIVTGYSMIDRHQFMASATDGDTGNNISWWTLQELVGENLYYDTETSPCAVAIEVGLAPPSPNRLANAIFLRELNQKSRYSREIHGTHVDYMIVPNDRCAIPTFFSAGHRHGFEVDQIMDQVCLGDNFVVLWIGLGFKDQIRRLRSHFFMGQGETINLQFFMKKSPVETAMALHMIFVAEFRFVLTLARRPAEQLVALLALTIVFSDISPRWIYCDQTQEEARSNVARLGDYWRNSMLTWTDQELGINREVRTALCAALRLREQVFASAGLCFNWSPNYDMFEPSTLFPVCNNSEPRSAFRVEVNEIVDEVFQTM